MLAPRCHPLLGIPAGLSSRCGGTVKAEVSLPPSPAHSAPLLSPSFSLVYTWILPHHHLLMFWREELSTRSLSSHVDSQSRGAALSASYFSASCIKIQPGPSDPTKQPASYSNVPDFRKAGRSRGVISAPFVASLAAAEKDPLLLSWLLRCGAATFCLNVSLFSEAQQQRSISWRHATFCITDGFVSS